jgi:hypothetical protein
LVRRHQALPPRTRPGRCPWRAERPEPGSDEEWRGQLRALADEFRALLERHPWLTVAGMNGEAREQDFEYALELLVSGIEAMAARD